jgi:hypothetical protein
MFGQRLNSSSFESSRCNAIAAAIATGGSISTLAGESQCGAAWENFDEQRHVIALNCIFAITERLRISVVTASERAQARREAKSGAEALLF